MDSGCQVKHLNGFNAEVRTRNRSRPRFQVMF